MDNEEYEVTISNLWDDEPIKELTEQQKFRYFDHESNEIARRILENRTTSLNIGMINKMEKATVEPLTKGLNGAQFVTLLKEIGFFDLEIIRNLKGFQIDNLVSTMSNRSKDNIKKYIRNQAKDKVNPKDPNSILSQILGENFTL